MPDELMKFMPDKRLMSPNEITELAGIFAEIGLKKVRFTGGEPTLRTDLEEILAGINTLHKA